MYEFKHLWTTWSGKKLTVFHLLKEKVLYLSMILPLKHF